MTDEPTKDLTSGLSDRELLETILARLVSLETFVYATKPLNQRRDP